MDGNDFDEEKFDAIVRDILMNINTNKPFNKKVFNEAKGKIIENIGKKIYTKKELNTTANMLLEKINKKKMTKKDIKKAAEEIKEEYLSSNPFLEMDGMSFTSQVESMFKVIIETMLNILNKAITLFVAICIVLNLYFRGNVDSKFLYPSNPNAFPYVYFDSNSNIHQKFLTSSSELNIQDKEDAVFLDVPTATSSKNEYKIAENICKINDPHGTREACKTNSLFNENAQHFKQEQSYENMNYF